MTHEQQLRDLLEDAVPEPPDLTTAGPGARDRWRRNSRRRIGAVVAVTAVIAVGVPALRSTDARHESGPQVSDTRLGPARPACQDVLNHDRALGYLVDTRAVDSATATTWLKAIHSSVDPGSVAGSQAVNVCLFYDKANTYRVLTSIPGRGSVAVSEGKFGSDAGPLAAMLTLDRLWTGGASTTGAPFTCPSDSGAGAADVSTTLPSGATGALLCYGAGTLYSPTGVLSPADSDRLVSLIDASKLDYTPPNAACGGNPDFREYAVVFRYPTGTRVVRMEECRGLAVGPFTRDMTASLDLRMERMLLAQGSSTEQPPTCRPDAVQHPSGPGDVRQIVAARFCPAGPDRRPYLLSYDQLHMLRRWGHLVYGGAETEPEGKCAAPSYGRPHLELRDAWGNAFTMTVVKCVAYGHRRYLGGVLTSGASPRLAFPLSEVTLRFSGFLGGLRLQR